MSELQEKLAAMKAGKSGNSEVNQQIPAPILKQEQDSAPEVDQSAVLDSFKEASSQAAMPEVEVIPEKVYSVFYNTLQSVKVITQTGRVIAFVCGKYITDVKEEIDYLNSIIAAGSIQLSIKPGFERMTARDLDPMTAIRKQHMAEFKKLQAEAARKIAAGEPLSQSESEVTPLTPGSTSDIASLAADSGQ